MAAYPPDTHWAVRTGRFLNLLDDLENKLSPVKVNAWAANMGAISASVATALSWTSGHLAGMETVWGAAVGWLAQAHVTHHYDKRERNLDAHRGDDK